MKKAYARLDALRPHVGTRTYRILNITIGLVSMAAMLFNVVYDVPRYAATLRENARLSRCGPPEMIVFSNGTAINNSGWPERLVLNASLDFGMWP